jgi:fatty-acyl-CoA synthase
MGVKKGDRVGIWSIDRYEWVVTQFATALIGAVLVNVNPGYREKELEYCLNLVECNTLVYCQSYKTSNYSQILDNLSPGILSSGTSRSRNLSNLKNIICLESNIEHDRETAPVNVPRFYELLKDTEELEFKIEENPTFDDAVNIQFTSGTTGHPKAAVLTHHNIINNAYIQGKVYLGRLEERRDVICVPNPLYHCMGCVNGVLTGLLHGSHVVFPAATSTPKRTLESIDKYSCTSVWGTPTMYIDLLREKSKTPDQYSGRSIEVALMSGSPCPPETISRIKAEVFPSCKHILIPYGTTECSPVITMTRCDSPKQYKTTTVGLPLEHLEVKIADSESGNVLPLNTLGEVMCRGYSTFLGYYKQEDKTREVIDDRRWYRTGDIGIMNKEGYISITGRMKDMIIRGGENIYPREIEDFLLTNDMIADVNVIGVPDERMGEELAAFIILKPEYHEGEQSIKKIKDYCKGKIAHFKIPKHVFFLATFPKTVTLKVQKHKLKDMAKDLMKK